MFSISANKAVYQSGDNTFKVLDFDKMELEQPIELKCYYADPKLSQIGEFKLQASGETIKAFLAFSDGLE